MSTTFHAGGLSSLGMKDLSKLLKEHPSRLIPGWSVPVIKYRRFSADLHSLMVGTVNYFCLCKQIKKSVNCRTVAGLEGSIFSVILRGSSVY